MNFLDYSASNCIANQYKSILEKYLFLYITLKVFLWRRIGRFIVEDGWKEVQK